MAHKDPVTKETYELVQARDYAAMLTWLYSMGIEMDRVVTMLSMRPVCIAPTINPNEWGNCWGRSTLDHIKDQPRMGKRAQSDPNHLVSLCQGHTEDGRKAGYQWNTANRPALRAYLARRRRDRARGDSA